MSIRKFPAVEVAIAASKAHRMLFVLPLALSTIALYALASPGVTDDALVNLATGLIAAICLCVCLGRMAIESNGRARKVWLLISVLLSVVCVHEFSEKLDAPAADLLQDAMAVILLLISFAAVWTLARLERLPRTVEILLWSGFVIQAFSVSTDCADTLLAQRFGIDSTFLDVLIDFAQLVAIQAYLGGLAYFALSLGTVRLKPENCMSSLGDLARFLFAYAGHYRILRYPSFHRLRLPLAKQVLAIAHAIYWYPQMATAVETQFGCGLGRQAAEICILFLKHGLDAQAYYLFELYRTEQRERASGYLTRFETKNGLINALNALFPKRVPNRRSNLADKLQFSALCEQNGLRHIPVLAVLSDGTVRVPGRDGDPGAIYDRILKDDFFAKPVKSRGARGAGVYRRIGECRHLDSNGTVCDRAELVASLQQRSFGAPILLQPRICNHDGLRDLAHESLIAIRVFTCMDIGRNVHVTHAMLRVLGKLEPAWKTKVELAARIGIETGALGLMTGDKGVMACTWMREHPFTGAQIVGRVVPHWEAIKSEAMKAHAACGDRFIIGWDIACTPNGPLIIEGNSYPDVEFLQRVHGEPISESPLGPLLFRHLMLLQHSPALMKAIRGLAPRA